MTPNDLLTSPAGLEYLFKQYTGVIGQLVLPAISRDRYTGEMNGFFSGLATTITNRFSLDAESTNDISSDYAKAKQYISSISALNEDEEGIAPLSSLLTSEERLEAKEEAKKATAKNGVLKEIDNSIKELWSQYNSIMVDENLTEDERISQSEALRKEINRLQQQGIEYVNDYKKRWASDMNWIEAAADGWNGAMQTLKDSGEGLESLQPTEPTATVNPADLTVVQAGMPSAGDLTQTLPYEEEESENVQTPLASPDLTGNVTQAVKGKYTEPVAEQQRRGVQIGSEMWNAALRETRKDPSKYYTGAWADVPKAQAALRGESAVASQATTPAQTAPTSGNYNVAANVGDVSKYYNTTRSVAGDTLSRMRMRDLYGNSLSEKYYSELETLMDYTTGDILPLPQTTFKQNKVEYVIADYPGAETDMVNWFAAYYIPACNELMASKEYDKASADDKLEMLSGIRSEARKVAKTNFLNKYVK